MVRALSTDLDDPAARPYFVWDEELTFAELRAHLASPDLRERALWTARVMREARYQDVWKLVRLRDVVAASGDGCSTAGVTMDSSPGLSPLQQDLLREFFARERRFVLSRRGSPLRR